MKRIAFTIILNGLHHLKHNDYAEYLAKNLDYWIIVEGACQSQGSTKWCKEMPDKWHKGGQSIDGTTDFICDLRAKYPNKITHYVIRNEMWDSKDQMINHAIFHIKDEMKINNCFLFEIDIDEQWTIEQMAEAEQMLIDQGGKTGLFLADFYVGENLLAKGEWGEGKKLPYRRLWKWEGEYFKTHEPPVLEGGNGREILLPQRFKHYAYYFEQDVKFKNDWYGGHEGIYERWLALQKETEFPQPISRLITGGWGKTKTEIAKITNAKQKSD